MKTLILMRHAKAEAWSGAMTDFHRHLTEKGKSDAKQMAEKLKNRIEEPFLIISSKAIRAKQTAEEIARTLSYPIKEIQFDEYLFEELTPKYFFKLLHDISNRYITTIVIGHNPWISKMARRLCPEAEVMLASGGLVGMDFDIEDWKELESDSGSLAYWLGPDK